MNKTDILNGKFNKKVVNSLSKEEKTDLIFSLHDSEVDRFPFTRKPLSNIGPIKIKNIIKFLKLCIDTNLDNIEWYLFHLVDSIYSTKTNNKTKKFAQSFKNVKFNHQMNDYMKGKEPPCISDNVWFGGRTHRPLEEEKERIVNKPEINLD